MLTCRAEVNVVEPMISSVEIDGSNVNIRVTIEAGYDYLIYETKTDLQDTGAWVPRHSSILSGNAESLLLTMPLDPSHGCFRIRCYPTGELDLSLFAATSAFERELIATGEDINLRQMTPEAAGGMVNDAQAFDVEALSPTVDPEVSDSDIWAIRDDRLYFYNRNRGLQIIDITDPDDPAVLNTLPFAGQGERMFVLPSGYVVLLATGWCNENYGHPQDEVVIIDVQNDEAVIVDRLRVSGSVRESRLVGTALYVGSSGYFRVGPNQAGNYKWESRTYLTAFDLSDPLSAHETGELRFRGYERAVRAFPHHLVIVNNSWGSDSILRVIDIDHTTASMTNRLDVSVPGYIRNEYMVDIKDGVLSVFSEVDRLTRLRNYSITGTEAVVIGEVEVGHGESLFSARFANGYAYAVTFLRIDPLWIIDNQDPTNPTVSGELEVPGFSTYIHPLNRGGRDMLLTVGTVSNQVAVSLFDIDDVQTPSLISRIRVGGRYSWSEAQYEEQAFQVEEGAGLVLLPFSSYGARGLQVIGLTETNLIEGGIVQTPVSVRRSAHTHDRVMAVTAESLLTIDAADLQNPTLTSDFELARQVSELFVHNGYIIEVDTQRSYFWGGSVTEPVTLTVRSTTNDTVLSQLELDAINLVGSAVRGDQLYTMQADSGYGYVCCWFAGHTPTNHPATNVVFSVIDLSALPDLQISGQAVHSLSNRPYGELKALWVDDNTLVWGGDQQQYRGYQLDDYMIISPDAPLGGISLLSDIAWYPGWNYSTKRFIAYDVSQSPAPAFVSDIDLSSKSGYGRSQTFAAAGKIFTGGYEYVYEPPVTTNTNDVVYGNWFRKESLIVLDYLDPAHPVERPSIEYAGEMIGVANNGQIIYTKDNPWYRQDRPLRLHALAYDGVNTFPLDTLVVTSNYAQTLFDSDIFYVGTYQDSTNTLLTIGLDAAHEWLIHDEQITPNEWIQTRANDLLVLQNGQNIRFMGLTNRLAPTPLVTESNEDSCSWINLRGGDGSILEGFHAPNGWLDIRSYWFPQD
ncbi:MAG: hypothetical protein ACI9TH_000476 [Kiritimatiellia bacterium]